MVNTLVYINVDITNDRDSYTIRTHYKWIDICGKPTRRPIWHSIGGIRSCVSEREQCRRVQRADISRYSPRRYTGWRHGSCRHRRPPGGTIRRRPCPCIALAPGCLLSLPSLPPAAAIGSYQHPLYQMIYHVNLHSKPYAKHRCIFQ